MALHSLHRFIQNSRAANAPKKMVPSHPLHQVRGIASASALERSMDTHSVCTVTPRHQWVRSSTRHMVSRAQHGFPTHASQVSDAHMPHCRWFRVIAVGIVRSSDVHPRDMFMSR